MNTDKKSVHRKENPLDTANIFSKFTFLWMKDLFKIGMKGSIPLEEIYEPKSTLKSEQITKRFIELWSEELLRKHPSVLRVIFRIYGFPLLFLGFSFSILESAMRVLLPLCLGGLVSYFAPGQTLISKRDAYLYAGGIVFASGISMLTFHPFILYIFEMGAKVRIGCSGLVYRKTLNLSKSAIYDGLNGKVINLIANDMGRFELALSFVHEIWKGPLEAILIGYFIYQQIGIAGLIGLAFLLSFIPIQAYIAKKSAQFRLKTAKRTDVRVKIMNEIILGIQVIKMYAWEKSFASIVDKIRKKEVNAIRGTSYLRATLFSLGIISRLSIFISLVTYIYLGNIITAQKLFIVFSFFNILNLSIVYFWPLALATVAEGYISAKRIEEFLLASEQKPQGSGEFNKNFIDQTTTNDDYTNCGALEVQGAVTDNKKIQPILRYTMNLDSKSKGVSMRNVTATWDTTIKANAGIYSIDFVVQQDELCAVVGAVGAGKSTLLNVIIGELDVDTGECTVNGSISYASQNPWLFEGTIRRNIVFIEEFAQERYNEVVRVCCLEKDFELLPKGEMTIVGERGISLSGGQKARINLARALYKQADIYLLDDPLYAVDAQVGKHIFQGVQHFLKNKSCILVTHQLQYLQDIQHLVLMNHGHIKCQGTYIDVRHKSTDTFLTIQSPDETSNEDVKAELLSSSAAAKASELGLLKGKSEVIDDREETQAVGAVKMNVYGSYIKAVNSFLYIGFVTIMFICGQALVSGVDVYLAQWSNWEEQVASEKTKNLLVLIQPESSVVNIVTNLNYSNKTIASVVDHELEDRTRYIITYAILMGVATYVYVHRTFAFFSMCLKASIHIHGKLFEGVSRAKMYFYNNNSSGRILNRFSKDIGNIDTLLPSSLMDCILFFLEFLSTMIIVALASYWLLIAIFVISIIFYILRYVYINTARSMKRIESLTQSPIYSHTNATLQGLSTVRAYKAQHILEKEFYELEDYNTGSFHLRLTTNRAFAFWLDIVCLLFTMFVTFSFVIFDSGNGKSGNIGLAILHCINLLGQCQYGMRQTAEVESQMTSLERIMEYAKLPSEAPLESQPKYSPPKDWPTKGEIILKEMNFKYSENGNYVLKNFNLKILGKEKIGIVGRTGSGKSSIIQAILRLAESSGEIIIDGIVTNTLGLHDLRKKISIIPQDPVLFSGTLRFNLDPFDENSDEKMWNALEEVELKPFVTSLAGGLDCRVMDDGSNFSVGQRQLVCLARAILRNNKILICDEATANVDPETDKLIQTTIRKKFSDCSILTIAHRLHSVIDNDRILVVDSGTVVEYGHPFDLLQRPDGPFKKLVEQTGAAATEFLTQIAAEHFGGR